MPASNHRNIVLLGALGTCPSTLADRLAAHPDIVAPSGVRLTTLFHATSRQFVQGMRRNRGMRRSDAARTDPRDAIAFARGSCTAGLTALFDDLRRRSGADVVVLWDPDRMTYPFCDMSGIDVILLCPGRNARDMAGVPDGYRARIEDLLDRDIQGLLHRVRVWGVDDHRILSIAEDEIDEPAGLRRLFTFLGLDTPARSLDDLPVRRIRRWSAAD